ncbi:MAG: alkaline phosphatase D family protein [Pirellulales bacterium]
MPTAEIRRRLFYNVLAEADSNTAFQHTANKLEHRSMNRLGMIYLQLAVTFALAALSNDNIAADDEPISRIALGSCARENKPQPIWNSIVAGRPELFLFIGDNIYADTEDMAVMRAKYAKLAAMPGYRKLKAICPILATWDDHDYGVNDGGAEYSKRAESQQVFNDFFAVPANSPRRQRPGIYEARVFGPRDRRVQVILLDTRYFRGPLKQWPKGRRKAHGPYMPNTDKSVTMLGDAQWKWLAAQLKVPAQIRIVASSIQVIAGEHGWETWANLPHERARFFRLLAETKASGVILISGDRHKGELSRLDAKNSGTGYPVYDLTSSGLNQGGGGTDDEPNRHRIDHFFKENFGTITIDWQKKDPSITLAIHDLRGSPVFAEELHLSGLQAE